ncbi:Regulatory protein zeste [Camponotus japonicus]
MVKYKHIIENKKTDGSSTKAKQEAWLKIASAFNASTYINEKATDKQLQRLWANLKRQRSELAKERQHRIATGGGEAIGDVEIDPLIEIINPHLIMEIPSINDSDNLHQTDELNESITLSDNINDTLPILIEESENEDIEPTKKNKIDITPIKENKIDISPAKTVARRCPFSINERKMLYEDKKSTIIEKEAEERLKLIKLDKQLREEQIRTEREKQREAKARADIAELELEVLKKKLS